MCVAIKGNEERAKTKIPVDNSRAATLNADAKQPTQHPTQGSNFTMKKLY